MTEEKEDTWLIKDLIRETMRADETYEEFVERYKKSKEQYEKAVGKAK